MSTDVNTIVEVKGKKCAEVLQFNGLEMDKGKFSLKVRTQIRKEDGTYIEDPENYYIKSEKETAMMLADTFDVDGKDISGVEIMKAMSQMIDKIYAGEYVYIPPVEKVETEENAGISNGIIPTEKLEVSTEAVPE